jgi:aromatic-L-amino-acid decarboxylase
MYITHTKLNEKFALRLVAGQTNLQERHMEEAWAIILNATSKINQQQ